MKRWKKIEFSNFGLFSELQLTNCVNRREGEVFNLQDIIKDKIKAFAKRQGNNYLPEVGFNSLVGFLRTGL